MPQPLDYRTKYQIISGRVNFANFVQRRKLVQDGKLIGINTYHPDNDASIIPNIETGAENTTLAEYDAYLAAVSPPISQTPIPIPIKKLINSKDNVTSGGFTIGGIVTKDMSDDDYTYEFDPYNYQSEFFPGMADFIDENIVQGDKDSGDRLIASYWDDLGNDVFDYWGYFYIYDVESGKYYFPLISPQNEADGTLTTQTFEAFGRTFTIRQGWAVQGIFKFDISVADDKPFRFGAYGNMGSDSRTTYENLTYNYTINTTNLTLYYLHNEDTGNLPKEQLYCYFVPKLVTENSSKTYDEYYNGDDNSIMSKEITKGVIVYFAKENDVKEWVVNDLEIVS